MTRPQAAGRDQVAALTSLKTDAARVQQKERVVETSPAGIIPASPSLCSCAELAQS